MMILFLCLQSMAKDLIIIGGVVSFVLGDRLLIFKSGSPSPSANSKLFPRLTVIKKVWQ